MRQLVSADSMNRVTQAWLARRTTRPADVLVMKDGSLLVSDDYNGAVYRISYV
jgi:glucose/arabinose dehydrogenase